jgi:transcriptional regulator with XRE-family HTH domain
MAFNTAQGGAFVGYGRQIRRLREAQGRTAKWVAHQMGITSAVMSRIEHDKRTLKDHEIVRLAQILGVTPNEILTTSTLSA